MEMKPSPSTSSAQGESSATRRAKYGLNVAVLILSLLVILVAVNWLAALSPLRVDLTASREYSLSPQTTSLLKSLTEPVTLHLVFVEKEAGTLRQQVDDVLQEFTRRSDQVKVERIDPTNAGDLAKNESLIKKLTTIYAGEIKAYEDAAASGADGLGQFAAFAQTEAPLLTEATAGLTRATPGFDQYRAISQFLLAAPERVGLIDEQVKNSLKTSAGRPLADLDGALSFLRSTYESQVESLRQISELFDKTAKGDTSALPPALANYLAPAAARFAQVTESLGKIQDQIQDLKPLEINPITQDLSTSNCVILTTASRAATIPFSELFPTPTAQERSTGQRLDLRFSGERVVAAGIRRLILTDKPRCVFVHAEPPPGILMDRGQSVDVSRAADALRDLGFDVSDWNVLSSQNRPTFDSTAPVVWVIYPPQPPGMDRMNQPVILADVARQLIQDGQNVLLSYWPSQVAVFGQNDPWSDVALPLGITPDSARVIFEQDADPNSPSGFSSRPTLRITEYSSTHPIAAALTGLPMDMTYPVPLKIDSSAQPPSGPTQESAPAAPDPNLTHTILIRSEPADRRFTSTGWFNPETVVPPPADQRDKDPYTLAVAVDRKLVDGSAQRAVVVGCGPWFYTGILSRLAIDPNQGLILPASPGNVELLLNSVLWLAHLDDQIAPSALARSAPRIGPMTTAVRAGWWWTLVAGLPVLSLLAGAAVWFMRRG